MKPALSFGILLLVLAIARPAAAVDRHERVKVTAIKHAGKTVGFNLTLTLRPESYRTVRIGLGSAGKLPPSYSGDKRDLAAGRKAGYIRLKLGEHKSLTAHHPKEVSYQVRFGKGNTLKKGERVDVVTAWTNNSSYWHVYGMTNGPVTSAQAITLPK